MGWRAIGKTPERKQQRQMACEVSASASADPEFFIFSFGTAARGKMWTAVSFVLLPVDHRPRIVTALSLNFLASAPSEVFFTSTLLGSKWEFVTSVPWHRPIATPFITAVPSGPPGLPGEYVPVSADDEVETVRRNADKLVCAAGVENRNEASSRTLFLSFCKILLQMTAYAPVGHKIASNACRKNIGRCFRICSDSIRSAGAMAARKAW